MRGRLGHLSGISMKSLKIKNSKLQRRFKRAEKSRVLGKFIETYFCGLHLAGGGLYKLKNFKILRKYYFTKISRVRINTRCIFTNRPRNISKKHGASRFVLRDFIQFGLLPGYKKAVW